MCHREPSLARHGDPRFRSGTNCHAGYLTGSSTDLIRHSLRTFRRSSFGQVHHRRRQETRRASEDQRLEERRAARARLLSACRRLEHLSQHPRPGRHPHDQETPGQPRGADGRAGGDPSHQRRQHLQLRGALRPREDHAGIRPRAGAARGPDGEGQGVPSRRLRDRGAAHQPPPQGPRGHGSRNRPEGRLRGGEGQATEGSPDLFRHLHRRGDREHPDGGGPGEGDHAPGERRQGARGGEPGRHARGDGGENKRRRHRRHHHRGRRGSQALRGQRHPRPDRGGDLPDCRGRHGRRRCSGGLRHEPPGCAHPEAEGNGDHRRAGRRRTPGPGCSGNPQRRREDPSLSGLPDGSAGPDHGSPGRCAGFERRHRDDLRESLHARGGASAPGGRHRRRRPQRRR